MCSFEKQKESGSASELCLNSTLRCMPSLFPRQTPLTPFVIRRRIRCRSNCAAFTAGLREPTLPPCGGRWNSTERVDGWCNLRAFLLETLSSIYKLLALWFCWTSFLAPFWCLLSSLHPLILSLILENHWFCSAFVSKMLKSPFRLNNEPKPGVCV